MEETNNNPSTSASKKPPWNLEPIFTFKTSIEAKSGTIYKFKCKICPNGTEVTADLSSRSNLKRHLKRFHANVSGLLEQYDELCNTTTQPKKAPIRPQESVENYFPSKPKIPSQKKVDSLVTNFVISANLPFTVVNNKDFKNLITGLQPDRKLLSYESLGKKLSNQYDEMMSNIHEKLDSVETVCLTVDGWSEGRSSFLGVTAHWIEGLTRKSRRSS